MATGRDFSYLLLEHGEEGARYKFETACTKAFSAKYKDAYPIQCDPGDDGIDIYVGDFQNLIEVYQCKCFFHKIEETQKKQIRESYGTAIESSNYKMKSWTLCIPKSLTIEETKWWSNWKQKMYKRDKVEIQLMDSTKLLKLLKETKVDEELFGLEELKLLREIQEYLNRKKECLKEILDVPDEIVFTENIFSLKLESANIDSHEIYDRQFFNAEIIQNEVKGKGIDSELQELDSLRKAIHEIWLTQFIKENSAVDGQGLLARVFERIEDLDKTSLKSSMEISLTEKKGILHQLADECSLGWVKNYKVKLRKYIESENGKK